MLVLGGAYSGEIDVTVWLCNVEFCWWTTMPGCAVWQRLMLEAGGFPVVAECDSCLSALEAAVRSRPDAVLLDVLLPDGDGSALAALLADNVPGIAVVLTSSRSRAELGDRITSGTVHGFLPKAELTADGFAALVTCLPEGGG